MTDHGAAGLDVSEEIEQCAEGFRRLLDRTGVGILRVTSAGPRSSLTIVYRPQGSDAAAPPAAPADPDREPKGGRPAETPRAIVLHLKDVQAARQSDIIAALERGYGLSRSGVIENLRLLRNAGVIARADDGLYRLSVRDLLD